MSLLIKKLDQALEIIVILIMGALVIDVLWQVFSRFILSNPSSFTDELARFLLISVLIIGGSRLVFITLYLEQTSAALNVPLGYVYSVLPLSGIIMLIYNFHFLLQNFAGLRTSSLLEKTNKD